jgi:hypothetical protein
LHASAWTLCLILAPVSNISVRCSPDQYGSHSAAGIVVLRPTPAIRAEPSIFYRADIETILEGLKKLRRSRAAT